MSKLRVLDLFSGIGGFSLGLERTGGFETVAFCEIEEYPRRVLAKHWPGVPCYHDIRDLTADTLRRDGIAVDVICGGFPCQDISLAGNRDGIKGARSGLWSEYARLIGELRPSFVLVENVSSLLSLGMETVLGKLSALRYDAIWDCIPAAAVGAPHRRDRVWIIATDANRQSEHAGADHAEMGGASEPVAYANGDGRQQAGCDVASRAFSDREGPADRAGDGRAPAADADGINGQHSEGMHARIHRQEESPRAGRGLGGRYSGREHQQGISKSGLGGMVDGFSHWAYEPDDVPRVANGVPDRVARLKALGNAVVPQIPELIGRAILASLERDAA